jgi:hypothetical protein
MSVMNALSSPAPARKAPTQPLSWDWVNDWMELDTSLRQLEQRHCWNWRRDLAELEQDLESLKP